MARELAFSCYGAQLSIVDAADAGICGRLRRLLPPTTTRSSGGVADAQFVVERIVRRKSTAPAYCITHRGEVVMRTRRVESVVNRLRREIDETVAVFARRGLFVHAGVVGWRGRAIVIPGRSMSGKSHLVAELVRLGATYYSDEFAVVDDDGSVHPYARAPVLRSDTRRRGRAAAEAAGTTVAEQPLPIALVVSTIYRADATWRPEELRGARAVLPIIDNTVLARRESARLLRLCGTIAPGLVTLQGPRPDATGAAPRIIAFLDALLDGGAWTSKHRRAAALIARAESHSVVPITGRRNPRPARSVPFPELPEPADDPGVLDDNFIMLQHWHGRFGNRMHQYAYGVTHAKLLGCRFILPSHWEGTRLFATQHHVVLPHAALRATLNQRKLPGRAVDRRFAAAKAAIPRLRFIKPEKAAQTYRAHAGPVCFDSVCAYHPGIFARMSREHLRAVFQFSEAVQRLDVYKRLADRQGTYDIAHLRRDDVSNPAYNQKHVQGYSVISRDSYLRAFAKYGFDPARVEWTSDDYTGKWHADRPPAPRGRWRYPTGSEFLPGLVFDWLEDFLRLYFARTIFRANSSFSWWAAFLAPRARVFSPVLDKKHIYGVDGMEEISVDFVEGNHPHWMYGLRDIVIGE